MSPPRTAATTWAFRRMTQRFVSRGGKSAMVNGLPSGPTTYRTRLFIFCSIMILTTRSRASCPRYRGGVNCLLSPEVKIPLRLTPKPPRRSNQPGGRCPMANTIDLGGRSAVVTGGAQGFGRAITERFLASGARIAIWDRDAALAEKTAAALGTGVKAVAVDVAEPEEVEKARETTLSALGRIDILVNNAGIAGANATTWETTVEEWRRVMRVNLDGPFICSRAIVPQ